MKQWRFSRKRWIPSHGARGPTGKKRNPKNTAKLLLLMANDSLHHNWSHPCPIALVRKGSATQALATRSLRSGELAVPLLVKKQNSVVTEGEGVAVHPKAVDVKVTWSEPASAAAKKKEKKQMLRLILWQFRSRCSQSCNHLWSVRTV